MWRYCLAKAGHREPVAGWAVGAQARSMAPPPSSSGTAHRRYRPAADVSSLPQRDFHFLPGRRDGDLSERIGIGEGARQSCDTGIRTRWQDERRIYLDIVLKLRPAALLTEHVDRRSRVQPSQLPHTGVVNDVSPNRWRRITRMFETSGTLVFPRPLPDLSRPRPKSRPQNPLFFRPWWTVKLRHRSGYSGGIDR